LADHNSLRERIMLISLVARLPHSASTSRFKKSLRPFVLLALDYPCHSYTAVPLIAALCGVYEPQIVWPPLFLQIFQNVSNRVFFHWSRVLFGGIGINMRLPIYSRISSRRWQVYKNLSFPKHFPASRSFHASVRAQVIKPFLLADIGEG
jgi:hypothetical protein